MSRKTGPPIDYGAFADIFSEEALELIRRWEKNLPSLTWDKRAIVSLFEGYPVDVRHPSFRQADELNNDGWDCHERRDYVGALSFYEQALKFLPEFPLVWNNIGLAHYRLSQPDPAKEAYLRAISINPLFVKPYSNLGILFLELKHDPRTAERWFRQALCIDPNYQRAREFLAYCRSGVTVATVHVPK